MDKNKKIAIVTIVICILSVILDLVFSEGSHNYSFYNCTPGMITLFFLFWFALFTFIYFFTKYQNTLKMKRYYILGLIISVVSLGLSIYTVADYTDITFPSIFILFTTLYLLIINVFLLKDTIYNSKPQYVNTNNYNEINNLQNDNNNKAVSNYSKEPPFILIGIGGQMTVDNRTITIERKGVLGTLAHGIGNGAKTIPMKSIHSLQFKLGSNTLNGFFQFGVAGGIEKKGGIFSNTGDENSVFFSQKDNDFALVIKEFIENIIYADNSQPAFKQEAPKADPLEQIKKLKELKDTGLISDEEFEEKRKKLLSEI